MSLNDEIKLHTAITKNITKKCKCVHSVDVYEKKKLCTYCGNYVFKNKEDEFKYRLNEKMLKK